MWNFIVGTALRAGGEDLKKAGAPTQVPKVEVPKPGEVGALMQRLKDPTGLEAADAIVNDPEQDARDYYLKRRENRINAIRANPMEPSDV
jgi:hypothetical protein